MGQGGDVLDGPNYSVPVSFFVFFDELKSGFYFVDLDPVFRVTNGRPGLEGRNIHVRKVEKPGTRYFDHSEGGLGKPCLRSNEIS